MRAKVLHVAGARPNFMKIAPLMRAMQNHPQIEPMLVHTGQHYDPNLSDVFFRELAIPAPDVHLGVGSLPRLQQIACIEERFDPVMAAARPSLVVVVGDVNSTVACARVARAHGVQVAHVEAGLRSFDVSMPEELNRLETDQLSDLLFVTEDSGMLNLARENVRGTSFMVGNTMIDTLVQHLNRIETSTIIERLSLEVRGFLVCTFHRPSNVDTRESLTALVEALETVSELFPAVLPIHPRTSARLAQFGLRARVDAIRALKIVDPLGYFDFMRLVRSSAGVITDSGGIQEETTYLGIPCLTMRENTERPVTVEVGTNVLIGSLRSRLLEAIHRIRTGTFKKGRIPPLWDGCAAERIVERILQRC